MGAPVQGGNGRVKHATFGARFTATIAAAENAVLEFAPVNKPIQLLYWHSPAGSGDTIHVETLAATILDTIEDTLVDAEVSHLSGSGTALDCVVRMGNSIQATFHPGTGDELKHFKILDSAAPDFVRSMNEFLVQVPLVCMPGEVLAIVNNSTAEAMTAYFVWAEYSA